MNTPRGVHPPIAGASHRSTAPVHPTEVVDLAGGFRPLARHPVRGRFLARDLSRGRDRKGPGLNARYGAGGPAGPLEVRARPTPEGDPREQGTVTFSRRGPLTTASSRGNSSSNSVY